MSHADYEFSYNGLTFGASNDVGVMSIEGLTDLEISLGDSAIPRESGDVPGLAAARPRQIILNLKASGVKRSQALADTLSDALAAFSMSQEPIPLTFKEPGNDELLIYCRVIGTSTPRNPSLTFGYRPFTVRLKAADPRVYGAALLAEQLPLYNPSGCGLDYGIDYGADFIGGATNEKVLSNAGNANAHPLLRFYGATSGTTTAVKLTNTTTGQTIDISAAILTGQILEADMRRIITVDPGATPYIHIDGSNRYGDWALPREPFYLAPGDNLIRYEITGTSTDTICVINHRNTWL